jgi:DNA primase
MLGRLMFPIMDAHGRVRGFGARALSQQGPKYLNSSDSPLFHKSQLLYGLAQGLSAIRTQKEAMIVEGYFDVLALHQAGFPCAVSPLSTTPTRSQLTLLRPHVDRLTLLFDGDTAGAQGVVRTLVPAEAAGVPTTVATLPPGQDPDSYLATKSRAALENVLAQAQPLHAYVLKHLVANQDKARAARKALELSCAFTHPVTRLTFLQQAEEVFGFPSGSLIEAAGIGSAARQRLEEILCDLLQTIPAVRQRLRGVSLPITDPQLRTMATKALYKGSKNGSEK